MELSSGAMMGSIIIWYRITLTSAHNLRTIAPTTGLSLESRHRVGPLDSAERLTGLGSYLFWPGFHIWDVFIEVNENPGRKVQLFRTNLFASDFLEQPGTREIPVIIDGGQGNPQNLRYLLIAHASEIPQFDQFGLNGILDAERVKHFVHGQQLVIRARSSQFKFLNFHALEAPPVTLSLFAPSTIYQDVAHRLGRSRKKMRAISERRILGPDQPQPGLMHQGSRLKRLAGSLLRHLRRCQMPQFIVNQFEQLGGGLGIALLYRS